MVEGRQTSWVKYEIRHDNQAMARHIALFTTTNPGGSVPEPKSFRKRYPTVHQGTQAENHPPVVYPGRLHEISTGGKNTYACSYPYSIYNRLCQVVSEMLPPNQSYRISHLHGANLTWYSILPEINFPLLFAIGSQGFHRLFGRHSGFLINGNHLASCTGFNAF